MRHVFSNTARRRLVYFARCPSKHQHSEPHVGTQISRHLFSHKGWHLFGHLLSRKNPDSCFGTLILAEFLFVPWHVASHVAFRNMSDINWSGKPSLTYFDMKTEIWHILRHALLQENKVHFKMWVGKFGVTQILTCCDIFSNMCTGKLHDMYFDIMSNI